MAGDHLPDPAGGGQHVSIPRPQFSRAQPHYDPSEQFSHVTVCLFVITIIKTEEWVFVFECQPLAADSPGPGNDGQ